MYFRVREYPHLGVGDKGKTLQRALMFYGRYISVVAVSRTLQTLLFHAPHSHIDVVSRT
jgi:hypothetical protein